MRESETAAELFIGETLDSGLARRELKYEAHIDGRVACHRERQPCAQSRAFDAVHQQQRGGVEHQGECGEP
jgi:hypothetical protein